MYTVVVESETSSGVEQRRRVDDTKDAAEESPSIPNAQCNDTSDENDIPLTLNNEFPPKPTEGLIVVNIGRETYSKVIREMRKDSNSETMATETFPTGLLGVKQRTRPFPSHCASEYRSC